MNEFLESPVFESEFPISNRQITDHPSVLFDIWFCEFEDSAITRYFTLNGTFEQPFLVVDWAERFVYFSLLPELNPHQEKFSVGGLFEYDPRRASNKYLAWHREPTDYADESDTIFAAAKDAWDAVMEVSDVDTARSKVKKILQPY